MKHFVSAMGTFSPLDDDDEADLYGIGARQAREHLRKMAPERRAELEREWTDNNTDGGC